MGYATPLTCDVISVLTPTSRPPVAHRFGISAAHPLSHEVCDVKTVTY